MVFVLAPRPLWSHARPVLLQLRTLATVADQPPPAVPAVQYEDGAVRHDWRRSEIQRIYDAPLIETIFRAVGRPWSCRQ